MLLLQWRGNAVFVTVTTITVLNVRLKTMNVVSVGKLDTGQMGYRSKGKRNILLLFVVETCTILVATYTMFIVFYNSYCNE